MRSRTTVYLTPAHGYVHPACPIHPRSASRSSTPSPSSTAAGTRRSGASATPSLSRPTSSATATTCCAPSSAIAGADKRRWREAALHRVDAQIEGVRWAGEFEVDTAGGWEYTIEAWTDRFGTWRDELSASCRRGSTTWPARSRRGRCCSKAAAANAKNASERRLIDHALTTLDDGKIPESAKCDVVLGDELFAAVERTQERHGAVRAGPIVIEVDRLRARFGSWYELFPRSWGGLERRREAALQARRARLRRPLPAADPSDRPHEPQGPRQRARRPGRGDPGSPWAIGDETGGHDAVHHGARDEEGPRASDQGGAEARDRHRARLRDPVLGRPPVAERAPGVVPPPPRRDAQVRREPAQALPGHLQRQLGLRGLARTLGRAAGRGPALGRLRRQGVPRRQPAHQAVAVLGVADRAGARVATATSCSSPRRSPGGR